MRAKLYLLLIHMIIFSSCAVSKGQTTRDSLQSHVNIPEHVRAQLACSDLGKHVLEDSNDSLYMAMYVHNLIDIEDLEFKPGIYSYQRLGPHFTRKIFIYYKDEIHPFRSVFINDLLEEFLRYTEQVNLPIDFRIKYLEAISSYLKEEYEAEVN